MRVPPLRGKMTMDYVRGLAATGRKKDGVTVILLWDAGPDTGTWVVVW